jgi:hypothetical protein
MFKKWLSTLIMRIYSSFFVVIKLEKKEEMEVSKWKGGGKNYLKIT